jgi:predicted DNA-binding ribbon-helix-helix protein
VAGDGRVQPRSGSSPELWQYLRVIAAELGTSAIKLIGGIAIVRSHKRSLSAELRVFIAQYFANASPRYGLPDLRAGFLSGLRSRASPASAG